MVLSITTKYYIHQFNVRTNNLLEQCHDESTGREISRGS